MKNLNRLFRFCFAIALMVAAKPANVFSQSCASAITVKNVGVSKSITKVSLRGTDATTALIVFDKTMSLAPGGTANYLLKNSTGAQATGLYLTSGSVFTNQPTPGVLEIINPTNNVVLGTFYYGNVTVHDFSLTTGYLCPGVIYRFSDVY